MTKLLLFLLALSATTGPITVHVGGLFSPSREADLRQVVDKIPGLEIQSIAFETAAVTFLAESVDLGTIDRLLKHNSNHSFSAKALPEIPRDTLAKVEIAVSGLDCKACEFGAYQAINRLPGVTRATASFKTGRVTALIDATQTSAEALAEALKKKGVTLTE
jgi:copper chaperone CopZ